MFQLSSFLLISIKAEELKYKIRIPIPLFFIDEIFDGLIYCFYILRKTGKKPFWMKHIEQKIPASVLKNFNFDEVKVLKLAQEMIFELRKHRGLKLLEVRDGETHVQIRLL